MGQVVTLPCCPPCGLKVAEAQEFVLFVKRETSSDAVLEQTPLAQMLRQFLSLLDPAAALPRQHIRLWRRQTGQCENGPMQRVACRATAVAAVTHLHLELLGQIPQSGPARLHSHCLVSLPVASLWTEFQPSCRQRHNHFR